MCQAFYLQIRMFDSEKGEESDADRALKRKKRANTQPVSFEVFAHLIGVFNVEESSTLP